MHVLSILQFLFLFKVKKKAHPSLTGSDRPIQFRDHCRVLVFCLQTKHDGRHGFFLLCCRPHVLRLLIKRDPVHHTPRRRAACFVGASQSVTCSTCWWPCKWTRPVETLKQLNTPQVKVKALNEAKHSHWTRIVTGANSLKMIYSPADLTAKEVTGCLHFACRFRSFYSRESRGERKKRERIFMWHPNDLRSLCQHTTE